MSIVTEAMKNQSMSQSLGRNAPVSAPAGGVRTNVVRLEKFKVHGGTVGGEKNRLDFKSLMHQIEEAKGLGHSFKEIMSGVVRAMDAGSGIKRMYQNEVRRLVSTTRSVLQKWSRVSERACTLRGS